jgi:hypothetical protein
VTVVVIVVVVVAVTVVPIISWILTPKPIGIQVSFIENAPAPSILAAAAHDPPPGHVILYASSAKIGIWRVIAVAVVGITDSTKVVDAVSVTLFCSGIFTTDCTALMGYVLPSMATDVIVVGVPLGSE